MRATTMDTQAPGQGGFERARASRWAVVMAGGGGTRLWPASRRGRPKQLLPLGKHPGETLLAATLRRLAPAIPPERTVVVTSAALEPQVRAAVPPGTLVLGEPVGRNTAAALGLAAVHVLRRDPDAVIAALPADQHVDDEPAFRAALERALDIAAARDAIVTLGIPPTRPETGFGYLELGADAGGGAVEVARFVEKPDHATAERYLASGRHLWNAGIFLFRAARLLAELERHMPETRAGLAEIDAALAAGGPDAAAAAAARVYPTLPNVSIDHGVMERTRGILTLRGEFGWNDVGAWSALADYRPADADGNVVAATLVAHDARRNVVVSDPGTLVALVGVEDLIVIQAGDAVLVAPRSRAQDVKEIVKQLEALKLEPYL